MVQHNHDKYLYEVYKYPICDTIILKEEDLGSKAKQISI